MQLVIRSGSEASRAVSLVERGVLRVGRAGECEVVLLDPTASRTHVELRVDAGRVWLKDLNSRFGTFVNGVKTSECELRPGDVIRIGETTLRLDDESTVLRTTIAPAGDPRDCGMGIPARRVLDDDEFNQGQKTPLPAGPGRGDKAEYTSYEFSPRKLVGRRFGRFDVKSLITQSERGAMLRAHDESLRVDVALKVFSPGSTRDSAAVARLERAVKTTVSLTHPHLVELYDSGRDEGLCWIASEFVDGENAAEVIRRIGVAGMLDWRQTLKAAVHVARALEFIGRQQIVHRNISPRSMLFRKSDGVVKLGDLVLAKALDDDTSARVTRAGEIVGELPYYSPEQVTGKYLDARSDQYNLGATLYALLTGRPPCEGRSFVETLDKIQTQPPEPPTKFHLSIPSLLEGVVLRMLAKRPDDRFTDATALLIDLERVARYVGETALLVS